MKLFFDTETIPDQTPGVLEAIAANIEPPGSMKKPETILAWEMNEKPAKIEEAYRRTALDGTSGELVTLAWAIEEGEILSVQRDPKDSERDMIREFYSELMKLAELRHRSTGIVWVGHNVRDFDLRFLFQRSVILGIKPPVPLPHNVAPGSDAIFDTMTAWAGFRNTIPLETVCRALGVRGKGGIDGSKVWDYVKAGRINEVAEYCRDDVHRVREIYKRMTFAGIAEQGGADDDLNAVA